MSETGSDGAGEADSQWAAARDDVHEPVPTAEELGLPPPPPQQQQEGEQKRQVAGEGAAQEAPVGGASEAGAAAAAAGDALAGATESVPEAAPAVETRATAE